MRSVRNPSQWFLFLTPRRKWVRRNIPFLLSNTLERMLIFRDQIRTQTTSGALQSRLQLFALATWIGFAHWQRILMMGRGRNGTPCWVSMRMYCHGKARNWDELTSSMWWIPANRGPFDNYPDASVIKDEVIDLSKSPWVSPISLARRSDGSLRWCIDGRKLLIAVAKKDALPLPLVNGSLNSCMDENCRWKWWSQAERRRLAQC